MMGKPSNEGLLSLAKVEELLNKASDEKKQEKRNEMLRTNLEDITKLLDSCDAKPTRSQIVKRNQARLDRLTDFTDRGTKPAVIMGGDGFHDHPLETVIVLIQHQALLVTAELKEYGIDAHELSKSAGRYSSTRSEEKWTFEKIDGLAYDWVANAILAYFNQSEKYNSEKDSSVITAAEKDVCLDIIKAGSIAEYFAQRGSSEPHICMVKQPTWPANDEEED